MKWYRLEDTTPGKWVFANGNVQIGRIMYKDGRYSWWDWRDDGEDFYIKYDDLEGILADPDAFWMRLQL